MPWRTKPNVRKGGPYLHLIADEVRVEGCGAVIPPSLMLLSQMLCIMHRPSAGAGSKRKL